MTKSPFKLLKDVCSVNLATLLLSVDLLQRKKKQKNVLNFFWDSPQRHSVRHSLVSKMISPIDMYTGTKENSPINWSSQAFVAQFNCANKHTGCYTRYLI